VRAGTQADRGIFITTSRFTTDAAAYAQRVPARVVLIDGRMLAELMVKHIIGVQDQETYVIKRIDEDFSKKSTKQASAHASAGTTPTGSLALSCRAPSGARRAAACGLSPTVCK
jgi:Restriction endonuclease